MNNLNAIWTSVPLKKKLKYRILNRVQKADDPIQDWNRNIGPYLLIWWYIKFSCWEILFTRKKGQKYKKSPAVILYECVRKFLIKIRQQNCFSFLFLLFLQRKCTSGISWKHKSLLKNWNAAIWGISNIKNLQKLAK